MTNPSVVPSLEDQVAIAEKMYREQNISKEGYLKSIVCIAYQHALHGGAQEVTALMNRCDEDYLRNALPEQMSTDPYFCDFAYFVAVFLSESGVKFVSDEDLMLSVARIGRA